MRPRLTILALIADRITLQGALRAVPHYHNPKTGCEQFLASGALRWPAITAEQLAKQGLQPGAALIGRVLEIVNAPYTVDTAQPDPNRVLTHTFRTKPCLHLQPGHQLSAVDATPLQPEAIGRDLGPVERIEIKNGTGLWLQAKGSLQMLVEARLKKSHLLIEVLAICVPRRDGPAIELCDGASRLRWTSR